MATKLKQIGLELSNGIRLADHIQDVAEKMEISVSEMYLATVIVRMRLEDDYHFTISNEDVVKKMLVPLGILYRH